MKKLKSVETSENEQTSGVIFVGARSAAEIFSEYAIGQAARQVCDWAAPTKKNYTPAPRLPPGAPHHSRLATRKTSLELF